MPPEIVALIDKPVLLLIVLFVGAVIGIQFEKALAWERRSKWRRKNGYRSKKWRADTKAWAPKADPVPAKAPDAADQLRTVMKADFTPQPLLNKSEARLFRAMDKMVLGMRPDWQVMAQVSLGEILR